MPSTGNLGSIGALAFSEAIDRIVRRADDLLPGTAFKADVMEALRAAYAPGVTFRDAFARLLRSLLPGSGLVLMSADDVRLKRIALPLWKREVTDGAELHAMLGETAGRLEKEYHVQVRTSPTNLFIEHEGSRLPIDVEGQTFRIRGTGVVMDATTLVDRLEQETHRFTPNVVLRPLTQDWLLPTAAYVGGPGEVAYFAQFRPSYAWAGLPMPVIHPRTTVTLLEPRVRRILSRLDLSVPDFSGDFEALFSRVVVARLGSDLDGTLETARGASERALDELCASILAIDPTLERSLEATRARVSRELKRLRERVVRAERRRQTELREQLQHAAVSLFPDRTPQERVISPLYFAARFGPAFFPEIMERMDIFSPTHQVIPC